jgi:hypothetical protein
MGNGYKVFPASFRFAFRVNVADIKIAHCHSNCSRGSDKSFLSTFLS